MKRLSLFAALVAAGTFVPGTANAVGPVEPMPDEPQRIRGIDVSNWTGQVDWTSVLEGGGVFAFVYASEGTTFRNPLFAAQQSGAAGAGLFRGAYHFAQPHESGGAEQADFFVDSGGGWNADGRTLPGVLDIEDNPYNNRNGLDHCYGLDQPRMIAWLKDFTTRYRDRTGRDAIIYTTTDWWRNCTGNSSAFGRNPLWLARWGAEPGPLPAGWLRQTFWQYADKGALPGGQNVFNGNMTELSMLAQPPAELAAAGRPVGRHGYGITVLNTGPIPATRVSVVGRTFGGRRIVGASPGCHFSARAVRCTIDELQPQGTAELKFATVPIEATESPKPAKTAKPSKTVKSKKTGKPSKADKFTEPEEQAKPGEHGKDDERGKADEFPKSAGLGSPEKPMRIGQEGHETLHGSSGAEDAATLNVARPAIPEAVETLREPEEGMKVTIGTVMVTIDSDRK
ncbi:GH25 family lysozyme [Streptosporangium algeriense]|uniref:GH25 family lysozyme n=1 Tax=Streptosporangium algeriense TaxID=1682748 RepID=A0ABW3DN41_9ACTN